MVQTFNKWQLSNKMLVAFAAVALAMSGIAGAVSAEPNGRSVRLNNAAPQLDPAREQRLRAIGIQLGQVQLNALIDDILAKEASGGRKRVLREVASK